MLEPSATPAVALHAVTLAFGESALLSNVTFAAGAGEIIAVRGSNGSGKTSLLRVVANVARPTAGIRSGPQSCAYVPSTIDPLPLRARDWLRLLPRRNRHDPRPLLQEMRFDSDLSKKLPDLSFGNLRKLLLAEALSSGEPLLVIDELTAGLDRRGSATVNAALRRLANSGITAVIADQQDRAPVHGARVLEITDQQLVDAIEGSVDDHVDVTLRGPRSMLGPMTETAESFGFAPRP